MKRSAFVLTGAALLLPAAAWCAESSSEAASSGSWHSLIFYVINFGLFVWILVRYAGPAAHKFFTDRASTIKQTLARADAAYKEAQDLVDRATERMSKLEAEKTQLRADLEAETVYMANQIRQMAREAAERVIRDAKLTSDAITEAAHRNVREHLAEATGRLARELMVKSFTPDDQVRLLLIFEERLAQEAGR